MPDLTQPESAWENVHKARRYNGHPSGIETKHVIRALPFDLGCVFRYVVRRKDKEWERSLRSAVFYLEDYWQNITHQPVMRQNVVGEIVDMVIKHATTDTSPYAAAFYGAFAQLLTEPNSISAVHNVRERLKGLLREYHEENTSSVQDPAASLSSGSN